MSSSRLALFDGEPRKPRDERQLTEALARLCAKDPALRVGFARALLAALGSKRAASLAGYLPSTGKGVLVEGQFNLGAVTKKWLRESGGRPDLVVWADALIIVVEAKIGAGLGEKQLERYLQHPGLKSGSASGGVALVAEKYETVSARVRASRHWLGQATWRQLIPQLEKVKADQDAVHGQWQELLAVVQRPGDLGDGLVAWDKGRGSIGRRNRLILQSVDRTVVDVLGAAVAGRFVVPPRVVCQTLLHRVQARPRSWTSSCRPGRRHPLSQSWCGAGAGRCTSPWSSPTSVCRPGGLLAARLRKRPSWPTVSYGHRTASAPRPGSAWSWQVESRRRRKRCEECWSHCSER